MKEKKIYHIITFFTTTQAIAWERICGEEGIPGRLIPVPREISAGCGLAWRMAAEDYVSWRVKLDALSLPHQEDVDILL